MSQAQVYHLHEQGVFGPWGRRDTFLLDGGAFLLSEERIPGSQFLIRTRIWVKMCWVER